MKTFVFVIRNEQTKTFSMLVKKYLTLNANIAKKQRKFGLKIVIFNVIKI